MTPEEITNSGVLKQPQENKNSIVVNQIIVRTIDRTMKDIAVWKAALMAAERPIWPIRQRLYDTYSDIEIDGHLSGLVEKRFGAVLNKEIYFKDKTGKKVDAYDDLIRSVKFYNIRRENLHTILWGVSGAEFIPGKEFDFVKIPRKHIKPEYKIITKEQYGFDGFEYESMENIIVLGEPKDLGIYLKCAPYALWKRGGFADYAQFVEIFGQPVRIFEYDAYDIDTKMQLTDIVETSGSSLSLMIPKQAGFKMEDGKTSNANGDLQTQFINALNAEMSVIVLGNTETTTSSSSSGYAQSKEHGKQQLEITKSDMAYELRFLNSTAFKNILKSYGYPTDGHFCYEQEANVNELASRILVDSQLAKIVPISDDYFYETYHIPKPDNYDELKSELKAQLEVAKNKPSKNNKDSKPLNNNDTKVEEDDDENDEVENLTAKLNLIDRLKANVFDFFAQAPKD